MLQNVMRIFIIVDRSNGNLCSQTRTNINRNRHTHTHIYSHLHTHTHTMKQTHIHTQISVFITKHTFTQMLLIHKNNNIAMDIFNIRTLSCVMNHKKKQMNNFLLLKGCKAIECFVHECVNAQAI
jgi:hypothetical protein